MRDLPANIFAGCFMLTMALFLPLVIFFFLLGYAWRGVFGGKQ